MVRAFVDLLAMYAGPGGQAGLFYFCLFPFQVPSQVFEAVGLVMFDGSSELVPSGVLQECPIFLDYQRDLVIVNPGLSDRET